MQDRWCGSVRCGSRCNEWRDERGICRLEISWQLRRGPSMSMRLRYLVVLILVLAAAALVTGRRLLHPGVALHAASLSSTPSQSYLIALGVGDLTPTAWDGSITVTGATILSLQG